MDLVLQKQHENMGAYDMIVHLRQLYQEQAQHERFEIYKALFQVRLTEGSPVGPHVLKMIGYVETVGRLRFPLSQEFPLRFPLKDLRDSRSLAKGVVDLRVGNGAMVAALTVTQEPRRPGRIHHEPERYGFLMTQDNDILLVDNDEPTTYAEAVIGLDFEKWLEAMRFEMESIYTNQLIMIMTSGKWMSKLLS
ncbi:hypothetical protein CRG98_012059 [Punica granatum]|uniref:Uncharacterized protein n=1 Tax=Punica granatum TaxID=22663 RepID=A0A2I0KG43_PUNGR|nr:hypothetical protein CRG98_012059 [Punica granatum]